jgi:predicted ATPase/class 3 adenylate cyclase
MAGVTMSDEAHGSGPTVRPSSQVAPRRAFLITDIERSTARWEWTTAEMTADLPQHDDVLLAAVADHGGRVVKHLGDGLLAVFDSVDGAVGAAVDAQRRLGQTRWASPQPLRCRMGIHYAAAIERAGDYFGPAVNLTSRLCSTAHPGQVLLSATAAEALSQQPGLRLADLGIHRLRDIPSPVRIVQVSPASEATSFPDLMTFDRLGNLPPEGGQLIGRDHSLESLLASIERDRLVTVLGTGGVGKTRLAVAAGHRLHHSRRHGVWFVDMSAVESADDVVEAIVTALGLSVSERSPTIDAVVQNIEAWEALLVVDNCEHVTTAAARAIGRILARCPGVHVVATSRAPLGLATERLFPLQPLPTRTVDDRLSPAAEMFVDRARASRPDFNVGSAATEIGELCRRLDGLPLAIELAAARCRVMTVQEMVRRLDARFQLLARPGTGGTGATDRHSTLRETIAWSYGLLTPRRQRLFERLSVFSGSFNLDDVIAVALDVTAAADEPDRPAEPPDSAPGGADLRVLDDLQALVVHSLVDSEVRGSVTTFRLLESMREFGRERLADRRELSGVSRRHAQHFARLCELSAAGCAGPDEERWVARMNEAWTNVRTAHAWTIANHDVDASARLVAGVHWFAFWRMRYEYARWAETTLAAPGIDQHPLAGDVHGCAGFGAWARGDHHRAGSVGRRGIELDDAAGRPRSHVCEDVLTNDAYFRGDLDQALALVSAQRERADRDDDTFRRAYTRWYEVLALVASGRRVEARPVAEQAHAIAQCVDNPTLVSLTSFALAVTQPGDAHEETLRLLDDAAMLAHRVHNRWSNAMSRAQAARVLARAGTPANAVPAIAVVARRLLTSENVVATWQTLTHLLSPLLESGHDELAARLWGGIQHSSACPPPTPAQRRRLDELIPAAQRRLGPQRWDDLVTRGGTAEELLDLIDDVVRDVPS